MKKLFCILFTLTIAIGLVTPASATTQSDQRRIYSLERKELREVLPFQWDVSIKDFTETPDVIISKNCENLSRDVIDEMGQIIYFSKEYCDSKFDDYDLDVYIRDEKSDSVQMLWSSDFTPYGVLIDKRSGDLTVRQMSTLDDLCAFFPALSAEINSSKIDRDDFQIYTEVMNELNSRMSESEEEIYTDIAPNYDMTSQQLSIFMKDVMSKVYSKNKDVSGATPITYPAFIESELFGYYPAPPDEIYTTPASENGREGEIYSFIGTVREHGSFVAKDTDAYMFILDTEKGPVMFYDEYGVAIATCEDEKEVLEVLIEPLSDYTFPDVGDCVKVYGVYRGYSSKYDMPFFAYGIPKWIEK